MNKRINVLINYLNSLFITIRIINKFVHNYHKIRCYILKIRINLNK